jgi:two-component system, OmpR family, phosphate regulon sensor histidine kinase PhoR
MAEGGRVSSAIADPPWASFDLPLRGQPAAGDGGAVRRPGAETDGPSRQADELMLLKNQGWFCSLRWLAIAGLAALALFALLTSTVLPLPGLHLEPAWPLAAAGALLILNVAYLLLMRGTALSPRRAARARQGLWVQIILDLAVLTAVVHWLGSVGTFAPFMYLFHIVLACIFLPYTRSLFVTIAAMGMYAACLALEASGLVPPSSAIAAAPVAAGVMPPAVLAWHLGTVVFVSVTVWYLASRLSNALRRRDAELLSINRRLEASTEERAGHMLRTTHQLKAPFAAIHANTQLLLSGLCGTLPGEAATVIGQIAARCEMLTRGITAMLQLANLRSRAQSPPPAVPVDLAELVRSCLAGMAPVAARRGIAFDENLSAAPVQAVQDHAIMIIENIVSNAVAYSRDGQRVGVSSRALPGGGAEVVVRDSGIGIMPDKLPRIFDDYYRTAEAARHNHASTGLGLAIVRQTALTGGISVHVESAPGRGTIFSLGFPGAPGGHGAQS